MDYTNLGRPASKYPYLFCSMTYGAPTGVNPKPGSHAWALNKQESQPFLRQAFDLGINFFDTANVFSAGASEEVVGKFLKANVRRESVVIATKVHSVMRLFLTVAASPQRNYLQTGPEPAPPPRLIIFTSIRLTVGTTKAPNQ